jgi:Holliday junction resolvasome RuvABC endonuclease subunit
MSSGPSGTRPPTVVAIGIDPGRVPGVAAVKVPGAFPVERPLPAFQPIVLNAWATETGKTVEDPTVVAELIAVEALRMAAFYEAAVVAIEIPKGMVRANVATYGAQRETIGTVRGILLAHKITCHVVAPNSGKMALTDNRYADKAAMVEALKLLRDFAKAWDPVDIRLEAKADALGVALAAAGWRPVRPQVAA